jgi:hypothetical protein
MPETVSFLKDWAGMVISGDDTTDFYFIPTLEGNMRIKMYDYVIKGVWGEFYPCDRDIFELTYEPVEQSLDDIKREWSSILDFEETTCMFSESGITYNELNKERK